MSEELNEVREPTRLLHGERVPRQAEPQAGAKAETRQPGGTGSGSRWEVRRESGQEQECGNDITGRQG